jgi:gliding motility-associated-like protein
VGYDKNPPVLATCPPIIIPDTVNGFENPIRIYVKNPYQVGIDASKYRVCVGEVFKVQNLSDMDTITKFRMYTYKVDTVPPYLRMVDTTFKTNYVQDSAFKYVFYEPGIYKLVMQSSRFIPNTPPCANTDTVQVTALKAKAVIKVDSLGLPRYNVWNNSDSTLAGSYKWHVYNPDGNLRSEVLVPDNSSPFFHLGILDFKNDTGDFKVCLWAMTEGLDNCYDSTCVILNNNFQISVEIPNVFTPNNDGKNDVFNIKINGENHYDLKIWNRWGGLVFESTDPTRMWNGRTNNTGEENPEGTYYFVFRYELRTETEKTVRGSITLIRD